MCIAAVSESSIGLVRMIIVALSGVSNERVGYDVLIPMYIVVYLP